MGHVFWRWTRPVNVCPALDRRRSLEIRGSQPPEDPPAYGLCTGHTWMPEVEMSFLMRGAFGEDALEMNYRWAGQLPRR